MRPPRYSLSFVALALVVSGCSSGVVTGAGLTDAPTDSPTTASPSPTKIRAKTTKKPSAKPSAATGVLRVVVQDQDDQDPRAGVPISYKGPVSGRMVSNASGVATVKLPAGDYRVEVITGCHPQLEIYTGSGGSAGVAAGDDPTFARLTVNARLRYWGATPLQHDTPPPWPTGSVVKFRFRVYDRCKDVEIPGKPFTHVRYETSDNIEIVGAPGRIADGSSDITIRLRCKDAGDASLTMFDPNNKSDNVDLLSLRPPSIEGTQTWCGN